MRVWLPYDTVPEALTRLGPLPDGIELDVLTPGAAPATGAADVEYIGLPNSGALQAWAALTPTPLPNLRWLQLASAGFEHILDKVPAAVGVCNAAGVHDTGTAELALGLALASLRRIDRAAVDRLSERFDQASADSLADTRVLIVGYGRIGAAIERRLAGFEVASVTRVARTPRTDPVVHAVAELPDLVGQADVIFIALPGSPDTRHLVDARLLARMADRTLIVNVGRGVVIDTAALVAENGRIRAALDVTDPEPLPAGHPLWTAPWVTLTPHVGGLIGAFNPRYDALIRTQLARLAAGQPPLNIVRSPS